MAKFTARDYFMFALLLPVAMIAQAVFFVEDWCHES